MENTDTTRGFPKKKIILLLSLLAVPLLITSCMGGFGKDKDSKKKKYFTGTEGVEVSFDRNTPPRKLYYYSDPGAAGNEFQVFVEVANKGASFARGGIYLSGYDPEMINFKEIDLAKQFKGACSLDIGNIGMGRFGGVFRCDGVEIGKSSQGGTYADIDDLGKTMSQLGVDWFDSNKIGKISASYEDKEQGPALSLSYSNPNLDLEYVGHGRLLIALFSGLDFDRHYGREFILAGDTLNYPGGEVQYFEYNGEIVNWPKGLDETDQTIMLTSCYMYTTFASPVLCVDPEPYSENRKVCTPKSYSWSNSQGAPVGITSVEQENTPNKMIIRLNIANQGGGTVYDVGQIEKCSPYYPERVSSNDLNVVYLGDVRIGRQRLDCYPEVIRLQDGKGMTTCNYKLEYAQAKSAYETPVVAELWYGYSDVIERKIHLKRVD